MISRKKVIIVDLPADRPELRTAFEQLASRDGWQQSFRGRDAETGEIAIIQFGGIDLVAHEITTLVEGMKVFDPREKAGEKSS